MVRAASISSTRPGKENENRGRMRFELASEALSWSLIRDVSRVFGGHIQQRFGRIRQFSVNGVMTPPEKEARQRRRGEMWSFRGGVESSMTESNRPVEAK